MKFTGSKLDAPPLEQVSRPVGTVRHTRNQRVSLSEKTIWQYRSGICILPASTVLAFSPARSDNFNNSTTANHFGILCDLPRVDAAGHVFRCGSIDSSHPKMA
jgi:hypothetical protein